MDKELELRMYFFTIYQLTGMQKGIQSGHAMGEYLLKYARYNSKHIAWDFLEKWKTWIVLNGGVTNDKYFKIIDTGSINETITQLENNDIEFSFFREPDLQDAVTSTCFICDERVFNYDDYPDFKEFFMKKISVSGRDKQRDSRLSYNILKEKFPKCFEKWTNEIMGDEKNVFLRELLKGKKFA